MPQLPSGRHAGIDPAPFHQLISDAQQGKFVHRLMGITEDSHLLRYLEVVDLIPSQGPKGIAFAEGSSPRPAEFEMARTGVMLDRLDDLGNSWTSEDLAAFRDFLGEERNLRYRKDLLQAASDAQEYLARSKNFMAQLLTQWWRAGVHPAQEEGWQDDDSMAWDDYDLFVALSTIANGFEEDAVEDPAAHSALMMTKAFLAILIQEIDGFHDQVAGVTAEGVRKVAAELRERKLFDGMPEQQRTWIHGQGVQNAKAICTAFDGSALRNVDRIAADILALAFVSGED
jgi:hypothetical protein